MTEGDDLVTGTDRWKALDFAPPSSGAEEPAESVLVEHSADGRLAVITLNRPHADNAITTEMGARLTEVLETIAVTSSEIVELSPAQRRVLIALCRPFASGDEFATPASNQEIADELVVSVDAVKTNLRALFEKFGVGDLARSAKRAELVKQAFQTGTLATRDLSEG